MKKFNISKRVTALALSLIMVLGLMPIMPTVAAEQGVVDTRVTDPVTLDSWKEFFGRSDSFTTEHAGLVWTDKSVTADASHFGYATEVESSEEKIALSGDKNSFLVSLSAMSSAKKITGETGKPIDIMMVLNMNNSMYNGSQRTTETVAAMLDSVNETIRQLQERNVNNRVGVTVFYGGQDLNQSKAPSYMLLLPLDRYVQADNEYLSYIASDGKLQSVGVNTDVKNENGASIDDISHTVTDIAGAYTQQGILSAMEQFLSADTKVPDTVNQGESRIPVMLLMSNQPPTAATNNYSNIKANAVMGNNTVSIRNPAETDFVTQLTAAYAKEMIAAHYEEKPVFYTLSLGTDVSYDVMDPSDTLGKNDHASSGFISGYWNKLLANNSMSISVKIANGPWINDLINKVYTVSKTTVSGKTFPSSQTQQFYVDKAFQAETEADLPSAFASIVSELTLQLQIHPTQVTEDENLDGYVAFTDKIGKYMSVAEMKGILLGERWYSGKELTANLSELGDMINPTALGDELVWSIQQRLGLPDSAPVRTLLNLAYQYGQLMYNDDGGYSNYFGWYSDNEGNYLNFWQEGVTNVPANATFKNKTYLYMGELDGTDGTDPTNMMYATVILQEEIATGEETVIFEVPAALLPTVTYNGEIDNGMLTSLSRDGAEQPIRLVYEVSLDEGVDETTLIDVVDEDYITKNKNADGSINFYTNQFETDGTVGGGKVNTYSHFHPSYENSQYYYTKNETIYADQSGTVYESDSAPVSNGIYYRQYEVYANEGSELRIETRYQQLTSAEINFAVPKGDNSWYIPNNTVNCRVGSYAVAKSENKTNTLENSGSFYLDVNGYNKADTDHRYLVGNTLGNNGKITVAPTTGIMLSAVVEDSDADLTDISFVYTVSSEDLTSDSFKTVTCATDGDKTIGTVDFIDGKANITLKAEESVFILGLPEDAAFSVTLNAGEDFVPMKATVDNTDQEQTTATVIPQKEHISNVTFTVLPMIDGAIYSISDLTKDYDGEPVVLPNIDCFGEGAITVEFKQKDEPDSAYTATPPSEAGDYFVRVSVAEWQNVRATSATKAFSIIDKIAPTGKITIDENNFWEKLLNKIAFGLFFNDSKTATVTATDAESGVKSVKYYVSNVDLINDASFTDTEAISALEVIVNGSWATYDKKITLDKKAKSVIYVKITDNAGNVTYISSEGIVLYSNAEAVTTSVTATYKAGENKDVSVNLNGNTINVIKNGDDVLTAVTDYTVSNDGTITLKASYVDTLDVGKYTFTVSYNPQGVETDKVNMTTTFTVKVEKADGKVSNLNISGKTYNGTAITAPTFDKLGDGAATIEYKVKGTDDSTYTTTAPKNVGDYIVRVTVAEGTNYKAASATAEFTISRATLKDVSVQQNGTLTYDGGKLLTPVVTANATALNGARIYFMYSADGNSYGSMPTFTNAGTYTVYYCAYTVDNNFFDIYNTFTVTIDKATVNKPTIASKPFNNSAQQADISDTDLYTVEKNNGGTAKGSYDVVLKLKDSGNYKWSTTDNAEVTLQFVISAVQNFWETTPAISGWTYGEIAKTPVGAAKYGAVKVVYSGTANDGSDYNSETAPTKAGSYTATFIVEGTEDYSGLETSVAFTIAKATYDMTGAKWDYAEAIKYDGKPHSILVVENSLPNGVSVSRYTGNTYSDVGKYTANVSLSYDYDNYNAPDFNYLLDWEIVNNWTPTEYTVSGNGWMNQDFVITAKSGYRISLTNTADGEWSESLTHSAETADGSVTFYLKDEDTGAISLAKTVTYKNDKTAPAGKVEFVERTAWEKFVNTITFGLFYKDEVTVKVTAIDNLSGVAKIEYASSNEAKTLNEVMEISDWTEYNGSFGVTLEDAKKFVYFVRITDKAGNVTYLSTDGAEYDTTAPVIEGVESGKTYYTTQRFTVKESNLESVTVNGNPSMTFALGGNVDKEYVIIATDKAGNTTTVTVTMKPIKELAKATENLGNDNVTSDDAPALKELVEKLDELIADPDTSDDGEEETLQQHKVIAESLLKTIEDASKAIDTENTENVKDVTTENVTPEDKTDLEKAKEDLEKAIEDHGSNYTDDEKKAIEDEIKRIDDALAVLNKPVDPKSPATGDNSNMFLWIALFFISSGTVITLTVVDRKRKSVAKDK